MNEKKKLRKFGITLGIVFGIFGGILFWRGISLADIFFGIGAFLLAAGLLFPIILKPVEKAWMQLALALNWFMTRVILGILYYTLITAVGVIRRVVKKDPLALRFDKNAETYWTPKHRDPGNKEHFERQY